MVCALENFDKDFEYLVLERFRQLAKFVGKGAKEDLEQTGFKIEEVVYIQHTTRFHKQTTWS